MIKRLQIRFIIINMAIVAILLVATFISLYVSAAKNYEEENIRMMESLFKDPGPKPFKPFDDRPEDVRLPYFKVSLDSSGTPIRVTGELFDLSDTDFIFSLSKNVIETSAEYGTLDEYNLRYLVRVSPLGKDIVFSDISGERTALYSLRQTYVVAGIIIFIFFLVISFFLSKWIAKPIKKSWLEQKQFVSDASHELKTPLSVIMTTTELLQDKQLTKTELDTYTDNILRESHRMRSLIERMLELARTENATSKNYGRISLSDTVNIAYLPFEPIFFEKGISLSSDIENDIFILGNTDEITQVVAILLDNASKYSSEEGSTHITLSKTKPGKCLLKVINTGEEIPQNELDNIFTRFYKTDKARTNNDSFGLGLAIAKQIVLDHHGRIYAESNNGKNSFSVIFKTI